MEVSEFDTDERILCSSGFNVATLPWCNANKGPGNIIVEVEFYAKDIIAIPYATDGKFRVKKLRVEGEYKEGKDGS